MTESRTKVHPFRQVLEGDQEFPDRREIISVEGEEAIVPTHEQRPELIQMERPAPHEHHQRDPENRPDLPENMFSVERRPTTADLLDQFAAAAAGGARGGADANPDFPGAVPFGASGGADANSDFPGAVPFGKAAEPKKTAKAKETLWCDGGYGRKDANQDDDETMA